MPSSSGIKLHKKRKHSSSEYSDVDEDVKMKETTTEWLVEGVRNIDLEKELEKRMRKRGEGYKNKGRYYDDVKEGNVRLMSTYSSHVKNIKHKDEGHGDKYRETRHREDKSKDVKYKREREKDNKYKDYKYYEDSEKDEKYYVDGDKDGKQRDKKYRESGRYRYIKERSRDNDKDEDTDYRNDKVEDQNCESEKRYMSDGKVDQISVNHDRYRSFANGKYHPIRDQHRVSKQEEDKSRVYNGNSNKDFTSANRQSHKITQKDDNCINANNLSQVDNDNFSVSSPYTRNNRFFSNHKSFFPPQTPFRTQTNSKIFPNCPSLFPNNSYISFPPIFNPIMHQYTPPIFHQPLLHNWGANSAIFGYGLHKRRRVNWENSKSRSNNQVWEDTGVTVESQSTIQKDEFLSEQIEIQVETTKNIPEVSRVYLSKIDISKDLTESDLYHQCIRMLDSDQESSVSNEFDCKILFLEEGIEADVSNGDSLFGAISNSVFKKAMSLYTKQRGRNQEKGDDSGGKMELNVDAGDKDSGNNCDCGMEVDKAAMVPELIQFESANISRIH